MSFESLLSDPEIRETLKKIIEYEEKQEQKFKTDPVYQGLDMKPYWELMETFKYLYIYFISDGYEAENPSYI